MARGHTAVSRQAESEAGRGGRVAPHRWLRVRGAPGTVLTPLPSRDVESLCPTQGHVSHITSRLLILSLLATETIESQMGREATSRVSGLSRGGPGRSPPGSLPPTSCHVTLQLPGCGPTLHILQLPPAGPLLGSHSDWSWESPVYWPGFHRGQMREGVRPCKCVTHQPCRERGRGQGPSELGQRPRALGCPSWALLLCPQDWPVTIPPHTVGTCDSPWMLKGNCCLTQDTRGVVPATATSQS